MISISAGSCFLNFLGRKGYEEMQILKSSENLSKKDIYDLTRSPKIHKMSDAVGSVLPVKAFAVYLDDKADGSAVQILSIQTEDGTVYATNSATASGEFDAILDIMGEDAFSVEVVKGTSKAGREYITLALA